MRNGTLLAAGLAVIVLLPIGCGPGAEPGAPAPASLQRLEAPREGLLPGYLLLADPDRLVVRETFEKDEENLFGPEGAAHGTTSPMALEGARVLRLQGGESLTGRIPVSGEGRYQVTVFAGLAGVGPLPDGAGVRLGVVMRDAVEPPETIPLETWHDIGARRGGPRCMLGAAVTVPPQGEALEIVLAGGSDAAVDFDALRIVRLTPEAAQMTPGPDARRVTLGARENRWVVPLFAGDRMQREIRPAGAGARLDAALAFISPAAATRDDVGPVTFRVTVTCDGQRETLHEHLLNPAPSARAASFEEFGVALGRWAGRTITLSFECEAPGRVDPDSVILLGSPAVIAGLPEDHRPPVIIISIDTLRRDRLGLYGYSRPTSPFLDALATRGVTIERAYSPSSYTLPTHASLLTGQQPRTHGVERHALSRQVSPILAEILGRRGYMTIAATGGGYLDPGYGFAQGFDLYTIDDPCCTDQMPDPDSAGLDRLLERIESLADTPFFLFLHTFAVHDYTPRVADQRALGLTPLDDPVALRDRLQEEESARRDITDREDVARLSDLYDATIRGIDRVLRRIFGELDRLGILDRAWVLVTSDHGEEFGEHGRLFHRHGLWEESIRVPQIWLGSGLPAGERVEGPVSLVDVTPTLLSLLGLERDPRMQGLDVSAHLRGARLEPRLIEGGLHVPSDDVDSLIAGQFKWLAIRHRLGRATWVDTRLFDLGEDPLERTDIADSMPVLSADLRERLDRRHAQQESLRVRLLAGSRAEPVRLGPEARRRLDELGYAGR